MSWLLAGRGVSGGGAIDVDSRDHALYASYSLGGQALMALVAVEAGRFCVVTDNQGAMFTVMRINNLE